MTVQDAFGLTAAVHVFVWLKSPEFAPVKMTLVTCKGAVPVLFTVTVCVTVAVVVARVNGKAGNDPGETEAFACTPLPESPSD